MDLHVYRTSSDRRRDLRTAARERGAVLALNAVTVDELVQRLTPEAAAATVGQRLAAVRSSAEFTARDFGVRYVCDAIAELKASSIRPHELRSAGADFLAAVLEQYEQALRRASLYDPQDRCALAASRVKEGSDWLRRFDRVVLHALYDLTDVEFALMRALIEALPEGGAVVLFNTTANVKPTQFAEWTWQRFVRDESLGDRAFPEFCRPHHAGRAILEKLFVFEPHDPLPFDDSVRIIEAPTRYKEVEAIGAAVADLLASGESPSEAAVVVRHIETYGEMIEDVFTRYGIPHRFETGVPLLRIPFIKYWLALLDLVSGERPRDALARVLSSAYFTPRLSPAVDIERTLAGLGYIDRRHIAASALARRKNSPLAPELERFERMLDDLERTTDTIAGFMSRLPSVPPITERDRQAWTVLADDLAAAAGPHLLQDRLPYADFRALASDIAALRTVDRTSACAAAPGLPHVRIIQPHSLGLHGCKWIFAPGFSDGEFPARTFVSPLLSDATVEAINARIRPRRLLTARDGRRREPLYLFLILDSAGRRATLSYPASTLEGDPISRSVYIGEIVRHYAEPPVVRAAPSPPHADGEWKSRVAEEWRRGALPEDRARALLGDGIVERAKFESLGVARARMRKSPARAVWHPSELNSLSSCPFVFWARHVLRLRAAETPDFEVPSVEIGVLAHSVLRDFHSAPVPDSVEEARARMAAIVARRLAAADVDGQGPHTAFDPALWKIRRRQLVSVLDRYAGFAVQDARDGFETQSEYLDAPLPEAAFGGIVLAGKPDHVAVRRNGPRIEAIRIDDFKYSAASSGLGRQLKQSFQIPVYAYLAAKALSAGERVRLEGRYLLLRSPGNPVIASAIDESTFQDVRTRIAALMEKVEGGRFEPDPADAQACSDCDYRRLCRKYGGYLD